MFSRKYQSRKVATGYDKELGCETVWSGWNHERAPRGMKVVAEGLTIEEEGRMVNRLVAQMRRSH